MLCNKSKLIFLAGGLNPSNVKQAISDFMPDVTDVSSGVELDDGYGKDRNKIKEFVKMPGSSNGAWHLLLYAIIYFETSFTSVSCPILNFHLYKY